MSSPGDNSPPHDPPQVPQPSDGIPDAGAGSDAPAPAPQSEPSSASASGAANMNNPTGNGTPNSTNANGNERRPLHSFSFFFPFPRSGAAPTPDNGERMGVTWTLEVFPNDGNDGPGEEDAAATGTDQAAPAPAPGAPPAAPEAPPADGTGAPPAAPGGENGNRPEERSIIFVVGPDGRLLPRPGAQVDEALGGQNMLPFLFPFPFFSNAPPPPDPAKAAELLASLKTVRRALLRRVDNVMAAEDADNGKDADERGWRCGICLEGPEGLDGEPAQPVKALPCNHLFHEPCLQPWFTSHHTCPTCRLDLDPLRTLHGPRETRGNPLRPAATGSGRGTPAAHPYSRDRGERAPGAGGNTGAGSERSGVRTPSESATPAAGSSTVSVPDLLGVPEAARLFDAPFRASPVPWDRPSRPSSVVSTESAQSAPAALASASAGPSSAPVNTAPGLPTASPTPVPPASTAAAPPTQPRPTPERRSHITIIQIPMTPPRTEEGTPAPAGEGSGAAAPAAPGTPGNDAAPGNGNVDANANANADADATGSTNANANANTTANASTNTNGGDGNDNGLRSGLGALFDFFFMRPMGQRAQPAPPAAAPAEPAPPAFVPQSLESWTAQREKTLGWRCDAVECQLAPPVPDDGDEEMADAEADAEASTDADSDVPAADKEMLAIYAPNQPPFPPRECHEEHPHAGENFVLLACAHRWHRACLETAERSAGHQVRADAEQREWVRCQRCRKEGWVVPRVPVPDAKNQTTAVPLA